MPGFPKTNGRVTDEHHQWAVGCWDRLGGEGRSTLEEPELRSFNFNVFIRQLIDATEKLQLRTVLTVLNWFYDKAQFRNSHFDLTFAEFENMTATLRAHSHLFGSPLGLKRLRAEVFFSACVVQEDTRFNRSVFNQLYQLFTGGLASQVSISEGWGKLCAFGKYLAEKGEFIKWAMAQKVKRKEDLLRSYVPVSKHTLFPAGKNANKAPARPSTSSTTASTNAPSQQFGFKYGERREYVPDTAHTDEEHRQSRPTSTWSMATKVTRDECTQVDEWELGQLELVPASWPGLKAGGDFHRPTRIHLVRPSTTYPQYSAPTEVSPPHSRARPKSSVPSRHHARTGIQRAPSTVPSHYSSYSNFYASLTKIQDKACIPSGESTFKEAGTGGGDNANQSLMELNLSYANPAARPELRPRPHSSYSLGQYRNQNVPADSYASGHAHLGGRPSSASVGVSSQPHGTTALTQCSEDAIDEATRGKYRSRKEVLFAPQPSFMKRSSCARNPKPWTLSNFQGGDENCKKPQSLRQYFSRPQTEEELREYFLDAYGIYQNYPSEDEAKKMQRERSTSPKNCDQGSPIGGIYKEPWNNRWQMSLSQSNSSLPRGQRELFDKPSVLSHSPSQEWRRLNDVEVAQGVWKPCRIRQPFEQDN